MPEPRVRLNYNVPADVHARWLAAFAKSGDQYITYWLIRIVDKGVAAEEAEKKEEAKKD